MSPGGHLVTTAIACAAVYAGTESAGLVAGLAAGGFLIDVDHIFDYLVFEGQHDWRPSAFLRYYLEGRVRRVVLPLHSYELLAAEFKLTVPHAFCLLYLANAEIGRRGFARAEVDGHLAACPRCRRELNDLDALTDALRSLPQIEPPAETGRDDRHAVLHLLRHARRLGLHRAVQRASRQ